MTDGLLGLGVSPGRTAGPVYRMAPPPRLPDEEPVVADLGGEVGRASGALRFVAGTLTGLAEAATGTAAEVLDVASLMAADPTLLDAVARRVRAGRPAEWAIAEAVAEQRDTLAALGGYLAERAADLDDIRDRALAHLLGLPMPGVPEPGTPFVLIAEDLAPADTARLDPARVLAVVTRRGGPTSHTAILARSLGLPAVVSCPGILDLADGTVVAVDGATGAVAPVPAGAAESIRAEAERDRLRLAESSGPGRTADGHPVRLLLNVGSAAGIDADAEGVGLFRTEFLFLDRVSAPSVAEQEHAYAEVFAALGGRRVVLRTLDAGADKPLPFLGMPAEDNPALGVRGLRVARTRPEVLDGQLEAVARAAKATGAEVWVMAPMVATRPEAAEFAARVRAAGLPAAGVMVEVPAAALQASRLLEVVDFLSIGTNDLSQYTLAADRTNGDLADLLDPWQPALLELVAACAAAGRAAGKPVGVCGEAAADPALAPVFAGLGITSLSMAGPAIPAVRAALAQRTLTECERLAHAVLTAPDAATARRLGTGSP
ncbi:MAG TPA: phosphoenolpyruvate--protein phosphotransferase [Actinophytocola sp.]|uniref:phosphoenolpyruvate--protein phosphotransferase n=1 Tax=Actinophytocola sp. TaxID=1872138 RepID=UPI002DB55869|nr:phosphoenolpyruvate--protein phosphotransferase [Actinophytocola sp.]HEU5475375.1 phosphoenolpyruvate--protein phosphotransferase [Actinophytocola sp.]